MREIKGIYEIAVPVQQLARAEAFYMGTLGFTSGIYDSARRWHFLRIGGSAGMFVLQEEPSLERPLHFAFTTSAAEIEAAAQRLRERGIDVSGPVTHEWMPARSIYFDDPDGHELELCAPLD